MVSPGFCVFLCNVFMIMQKAYFLLSVTSKLPNAWSQTMADKVSSKTMTSKGFEIYAK